VTDAGATEPPLRVLRIFHSAVVGPWRARDRELRGLGADVVLVSARRWNEGGRDVELDAGADDFVIAARTLGRHPYLFVYDPRPIWQALRSFRADVVDVHEEPASLAALEVWLLRQLSGCGAPLCLYSAQNIPKRYPVPFRWIERLVLRRAAGVHTCNDAAGEILRGKGFSGLVRNLGLGVEVDGVAMYGGPSLPGALMRVGYVGRLEPHKGVSVLVDAIAATPGVSLEVIGAGPEQADLERAARAAGAGDRVTFSGFRAQADVGDVYRRFDVLAVPSLDTAGWIEQFGRVAVEAMAAGLPVVASRSGALPEVVGDAGVLVDPGDPTALSRELGRLRDDEPERARLSSAARQRAITYGWAEVARRHLDFYRDLAWYAS
jgi:glycosyltransferase involved in cell wall biosynthesis